MLLNNQKGAAMIVALMVMLVLSILGAALWQYTMADTLQVSIDQKRMRAYYLAKSGADVTLDAWLISPEGSKPYGSSNTVYLDSNGDFVIAKPTKELGRFDTVITLSGNEVTIVSTGTVENIKRKVTVKFDETITYKYFQELKNSVSVQVD